MADDLNIKDIIEKTKNFDQPYAPGIPEGICEVEVKSFIRKPSNNGYDMLILTVADAHDRTARVTCMLELQWIEGTIRLFKGLYTKNNGDTDKEKETSKTKINKYFDGAKDEADLQKKCVDIIDKMIEEGCIGWLRVEWEHEEDKDVKGKYPDRALTAYEPSYRWKIISSTTEDVKIEDGDIDDEGKITTEDDDDDIFKKS